MKYFPFKQGRSLGQAILVIAMGIHNSGAIVFLKKKTTIENYLEMKKNGAFKYKVD